MIVLMIGLFNFFNLLFHFISGRLLGNVLYGTFAAVMGVIYIFNIPSEIIQTVVSRYTTKFANEKRKVKSLLNRGLKRFFFLSLVILIIFAIISPLLGKFLFAEIPLILLTGILIIPIFIISVNRGILQGLKRFNSLGFSFFSEGIIKLGVGTFFILLGMKVYGALLGLITGAFFALLVASISLKDIRKNKPENADIRGIYSYSLPVIISVASVTIMYSIDLILARRFFPDLAGQYAVISMLGKIIFFGTFPIVKTMFPFVSERDDKKEESRDLLKKSIFFVLILVLLVLIAYSLFPKQIISLLYGKEFLEFSSYLLLPSITMGLLSFSNIFIYYNLSTHRKKRNYSLIFFAIAQIVLLSFFSFSISGFMYMNLLINLLLFIFLFLFNLKKIT
nr:hypothetical protein [uncultured archaeon]